MRLLQPCRASASGFLGRVAQNVVSLPVWTRGREGSITADMKTPRQTPPNVNDRNARLKAALQANSARRQAQVRGRSAADDTAATGNLPDNPSAVEPGNGSENGPEPEQKKE